MDFSGSYVYNITIKRKIYVRQEYRTDVYTLIAYIFFENVSCFEIFTWLIKIVLSIINHSQYLIVLIKYQYYNYVLLLY